MARDPDYVAVSPNWLTFVVEHLQSGHRPEFIESPFGRHGVRYDEDEDGAEYATIGFNLPAHVFAEIEDGTYGQLQGFRIYTDAGDQHE